MKCIKVGLLLIALVVNNWCEAQIISYSNKVEKDIFQIELYSDKTIQKNEFSKTEYWSLPSALFRYGLSNTFELQVITPFILERNYTDSSIESSHQMTSMQIGTLVKVGKRKQWLPETSISYRTLIQFNQVDFSNSYAHLFSLNFSNKLTKKLLLTYNLKYNFYSEENSQQAVVNLGYDITNKLHLFGETSMEYYTEDIQSKFVVSGLAYTLQKDLFLNVYYGKCLQKQTTLAGAILTWRFNTKHFNA